MKHWFFFTLPFACLNLASGQDTFSIVAVDSTTGEVGSAGASCVDLGIWGLPADFLGDLIPGIGAINTQAQYLASNQNNARTRMLAGDTPSQIISWLVANDATSNPGVRQYGIAAFVAGQPQAAGHTGATCIDYKNHIAGPNYCIQGNILLGQDILDSMEQRFLTATGSLAEKLMAALQGANVVGADTRCATNGTSSLFAFVKVSAPGDPYGSPYLNLGVVTGDGEGIEPIDSLQLLFNNLMSIDKQDPAMIRVFPNPAMDDLSIAVTQGQFSRIRVVDVSGRLIRDFRFDSGQTGFQFSTAGIERGVYSLLISMEGNVTRSAKLIVQ